MFRKMLFALAVFAPGCTDHVAECNKAKVAARDAWGKVVQAKEGEIRSDRAAKNKAKAEDEAARAQYNELNKPAVAARDALESASRDALFAGAPRLLTTAGGTHVEEDHPISREFRVPELRAAYKAAVKARDASTARVRTFDDELEADRRTVGLGRRRDELDEIAKSATSGAVAFRDKVATAVARSDPDAEIARAILEAKPASDAAWEACKDVAP